MRRVEAQPGRVEERAVVAAAQAGDQAAFAGLVERHRPELQVHCYRMLGSWQESEDLVQETFLRAWRGRQSYQGRSTFRAWLYRIATNACLDFLARHPRRPLARQVTPEPSLAQAPPAAIPWLQPYPDRLLDQVAPSEAEPDAVVVAKETIELAFLAAIQHLPPRQRAVLILRDVLGWSAKETAALLEVSVAAVKSALQRARPTLRHHLPPRRGEWAPSSAPTAEERAVLQRYLDAMEQADPDALAELLRQDARMTMPLLALWYEGRQAIMTLMATGGYACPRPGTDQRRRAGAASEPVTHPGLRGWVAAGGGAHGPGLQGWPGAGPARRGEPACRAGSMTGSLVEQRCTRIERPRVKNPQRQPG